MEEVKTTVLYLIAAAATGVFFLVLRLGRAAYEIHAENLRSIVRIEKDRNEAREQLQAERDRARTDKGPQLKGHADYVFQIQYKGTCLIGFLVNLTNRGTQSLAHQWRIYIAVPDQLEREVKAVFIDKELTLRFPNGKLRTIDGRESIIKRVAHDPIATGAGQRGWLFAQPRAVLTVGTKVTIRFKDVADREWNVEHTVQRHEQHLGDYQGITVTTVKQDKVDQCFDVVQPTEG